MTQFADNAWFEVEHCCNCGIAFAMPTAYQTKRREDRKVFYCPSGHGQHYTGPTEADKLRKELERREQMLQAAQARAATAEDERTSISRAHHKMRERVMNGVCPCCNRTFGNLMRHMKTEHPEFAEKQTLATLRKAFGMTQADLAREAGVAPIHVSLYERDKGLTSRAKVKLDFWLERHQREGA